MNVLMSLFLVIDYDNMIGQLNGITGPIPWLMMAEVWIFYNISNFQYHGNVTYTRRIYTVTACLMDTVNSWPRCSTGGPSYLLPLWYMNVSHPNHGVKRHPLCILLCAGQLGSEFGYRAVRAGIDGIGCQTVWFCWFHIFGNSIYSSVYSGDQR